MESSDTGTVKKRIGRPKGSKNKYTPKGAERKKYTVSEKALAQRRENAENMIPRVETPEQMDYNSRLLQHIMQINEISTHADRNDVNTLRSCFINYLKLCQVNGFHAQNLAAYASMGFANIQQFELYCKKDDPEKRALYTFVKTTCSMFRESLVSEGKLNPVIGIFWQRNYDGLRNDTEQVQAAQEQDDELSGSKSYKEKYKNLIGE